MMEEGQILDGKYRLGPKLGEGPLGRVYQAQHTTLAKEAAVKVFRGELIILAGGAERFLADARAAWKVRHRNIVDVHEFGRLDERTIYVAMELVEGRTLQAYLDEHGRLAWSRARAIALQVCAALKAAHRRKVLHRGLKATNCFVLDEGENDDDGDDDRDPRIKVGDFAVVRTGRARLDPDADQTSVFLGDPAYAAPELNARAEPSVRSDVYAMGVLLYRMLTGELPFTGTTPFQVLVGHEELPVPRPRDTVLTIPEPVEAIILRALAKEPSERFETIRELELALEEVPPESVESEAVESESVEAASEAAASEDVPDTPLEDLVTDQHRQAHSPAQQVRVRDEAMHAAFERRDEDDGEREPTSMFAPQRLFPYYGPAADDLQPRPPPPSAPAPVQPRVSAVPVEPPRAPAFVPAGRAAPPSAFPDSTVLLEGGGHPASSPEATVLFDRDAARPPRPDTTDKLEGPLRAPDPESTVHLPHGGVPVAVARRTGTMPAPRAHVPPGPSPSASSHFVRAAPNSLPVRDSRHLPVRDLRNLPVRDTTDLSATAAANYVIIGLVVAILGCLVGLWLACPARAGVVN